MTKVHEFHFYFLEFWHFLFYSKSDIPQNFNFKLNLDYLNQNLKRDIEEQVRLAYKVQKSEGKKK